MHSLISYFIILIEKQAAIETVKMNILYIYVKAYIALKLLFIGDGLAAVS